MTEYRNYGPEKDWTALQAVSRDQRLWPIPMTEQLVVYDSPIVFIGKLENDDTAYLVHEVSFERDLEDSKSKFPRELKTVAHILAFPSVETLKATLHDGTIPTVETYEKAAAIHRQVLNWRLVGLGKPTNCRLSIGKISLSDISEDEMPYAHLRSGGDIMEFAGDNHDALSAACGKHYVWPLPSLHELVFHGCPRSWIGETRFLGQQQIHLHTMVDEEKGWELSYRLSFPDEATLRATLYQGYVATRETFRQATKIVREQLNVRSEPEHWNLKIETLELTDVPEAELPPAHIAPSPAGAIA